MAKNGWLKRSRVQDELIKAYLAYFGVANPAEWKERYARFLKQTAFRSSPKFQSKADHFQHGCDVAKSRRCKSTANAGTPTRYAGCCQTFVFYAKQRIPVTSCLGSSVYALKLELRSSIACMPIRSVESSR
jgi:hypothetical protein